jgi:hypothetical protein
LLYGSPQILQSLFFAENGLHGNKADKNGRMEIKGEATVTAGCHIGGEIWIVSKYL